MLDYIVEDFEKARISMSDNEIGGMVVCDSADQAKIMYEIFQNNYASKNKSNKLCYREINKAITLDV